MTKAPKTGNAGTRSDWITSFPGVNRLEITVPDGTEYPFFHDLVTGWRFDAQKAAPGVVFPADGVFREVEQVEKAVQAHHKATAPQAKTKPAPVTKTKPAPATETAPDPVTKTKPAPATETAPDPVTETAADPVTETAADPVTETTAEPVTETTALPDEPEHEDARA